MINLLPSISKALFYSSFYHWYQREGLKDLKVAMQKAADEADISMRDAHDLFKDINGRITDALADTGNRAVVAYFIVNSEKLAKASEELLQTA